MGICRIVSSKYQKPAESPACPKGLANRNPREALDIQVKHTESVRGALEFEEMRVRAAAAEVDSAKAEADRGHLTLEKSEAAFHAASELAVQEQRMDLLFCKAFGLRWVSRQRLSKSFRVRKRY